jgi:hypothetical protein
MGIVMPDEGNRPGEDRYTYRPEAQGINDAESEVSQFEDMRYIQETILRLTGGCEICQYSAGPFCKKHRHPIQPGDPRCSDFARRFPEDPETASKVQVRHFVSDTLGIKDKKTVKRLTGT